MGAGHGCTIKIIVIVMIITGVFIINGIVVMIIIVMVVFLMPLMSCHADTGCLMCPAGAADRVAERHRPGHVRLLPAVLCFCQPGLSRSGTSVCPQLQVCSRGNVVWDVLELIISISLENKELCVSQCRKKNNKKNPQTNPKAKNEKLQPQQQEHKLVLPSV